ncbi:MAG: hypothetical protein V3T23_12155 [Nitrososphaerales archaeon]
MSRAHSEPMKPGAVTDFLANVRREHAFGEVVLKINDGEVVQIYFTRSYLASTLPRKEENSGQHSPQ